MPQAIPAIGTWILSSIGLSSISGATVIGSITVAEVVGTLAVVGAQIGLASAFAPSIPQATPQQQKQNVRQPVASRRRYYARFGAAGILRVPAP